MTTTTDTPRTDACPHCGAPKAEHALLSNPPKNPFMCGSFDDYQTDLCRKGADQIRAMTTDTPRTISAMSLKQNYDLSEKDCPVYENYVHAEVCAIIERELNEYIDENMKLWKIVDGQEGLMRKMQAEVERLKKDRYPFQSFEQLCNFLTSTNLIDELAVSDPEGWDGGAELSRIEKAFDRYLDETNKPQNGPNSLQPKPLTTLPE